ncbi:signal peptidase II [Maribacter spongiicola]|uniref:Lipoprotein signal peptidase n=1 Tax=Maribacter spongiicola TaxID=1206753 RepID=A0A4R7K6X3_9FLAO|nr:signal peptidase II [Maribacter spongiicola]TDT45419.1 signal peptidase II [Maribacter spongiicola]
MSKPSRYFSKIWIIIIVLITVGCDQASKELTRQKVVPQSFIPVIENHLILTNVENTGAMLGFGQDFHPIVKKIIFQGLPLLVLVLMLFRIMTKPNLNTLLLVAFALVIGGGIGNLIDRIAYGSVTDFFQLRLGFLRTGIFNIADVAVTTGVLLLLFLIFRGKKLAI